MSCTLENEFYRWPGNIIEPHKECFAVWNSMNFIVLNTVDTSCGESNHIMAWTTLFSNCQFCTHWNVDSYMKEVEEIIKHRPADHTQSLSFVWAPQPWEFLYSPSSSYLWKPNSDQWGQSLWFIYKTRKESKQITFNQSKKELLVYWLARW